MWGNSQASEAVKVTPAASMSQASSVVASEVTASEADAIVKEYKSRKCPKSARKMSGSLFLRSPLKDTVFPF